jgi:hypothetical protein
MLLNEDMAMRGTHVSAVAAERTSDLDLDKLLHPAQAFELPQQVVDDPDLTLNEKRAILASWASDACAVEASPALRRPPGASRSVRVDEILEALRSLDWLANPDAARPPWRRHEVRRGWFRGGLPGRRTREQDDSGPGISA